MARDQRPVLVDAELGRMMLDFEHPLPRCVGHRIEIADVSKSRVGRVLGGSCGRGERHRGAARTVHVAQKRQSAIDGRTTWHAGYATSQRIRKRIEEAFGWIKTIAGLRKSRFIGRARKREFVHRCPRFARHGTHRRPLHP
jgi:hypothetical protein